MENSKQGKHSINRLAFNDKTFASLHTISSLSVCFFNSAALIFPETNPIAIYVKFSITLCFIFEFGSPRAHYILYHPVPRRKTHITISERNCCVK